VTGVLTKSHPCSELPAEALRAEIDEMDRKGYVFRGVALVRALDALELVTLYMRLDA